MTEMPQILILVGAARSGSTLAGMMLGQSGHFVYAGELNHLWDRGLAMDHLCGCGRRFSACDTWQGIVADAGIDTVDGQRRYDAIQRLQAARYSINPFKSKRAVPPVDGEDRIRADIKSLYATLARRNGRNWVLDGAKQPIYARLLVDVFGRENVHVLHLVRDPRGVAFSAAKRRAKTDTGREGDQMVRRSPVRSAINWLKLDLSARALRKEAGSYHLLRYEDLCADGPRLIRDLLGDLGLEPDATLAASAEAATTHTISGNPIRMQGVPQTVKVDDEWRMEMRIRERLLVGALCLPGIVRYSYLGYRKMAAPVCDR